MHSTHALTLATLICASATNGGEASAATTTGVETRDDALRVDVEFDPLAYVFGGYSVHVGIGTGHFRFDLGAFALDLPTWAHGGDGFSVGFDGFGVKAHAFLDGSGAGGFVGLSAGLVHTLVARDGTGLAQRDTHFSAGVELGWLFRVAGGFYVKPWVGVGWDFGAEDVTLADQTLEARPLQVFPTLHLGWAF